MGGLLGGGPKGMLAPPSQIIGGAWPPWPPLFLRLCSYMLFMRSKVNFHNLFLATLLIFETLGMNFPSVYGSVLTHHILTHMYWQKHATTVHQFKDKCTVSMHVSCHDTGFLFISEVSIIYVVET